MSDNSNSAVTEEISPVANVPKKKQNSFARGLKEFGRGKFWRSVVRHKALYLMVLPAVILVGIFSYAPMFGLAVAFQQYDIFEGVGGSEFIGFQLIVRIFKPLTPGAYIYFRNTIYIALIRIGTNFPLILIYTLLINEVRNKKIKGIYQVISYLPFFISWVAVGGMCTNLFAADTGIMNRVLSAISGKKVQIVWYSAPQYWWYILATASLWKGLGWGTMMYLSAIGNVSGELYDACRIDGGGRFRQAITVTLPGIMNVIMLQLIMDVAGLVRDDYTMIVAMTNSSWDLASTTDVVGTLSYRAITGTGGGGLSSATAYGLVQGVIGLILVLFTNRIVKKSDNEGIL